MKSIFIFFLSVSTAFTSLAQNKIILYHDTAQMRKEILAHIPPGTTIPEAEKIMKENHFETTIERMGTPGYSPGFLKVAANHLFCRRIKSGGFFIEKTYAIAILFQDEKVMDVKNELWLTGP